MKLTVNGKVIDLEADGATGGGVTVRDLLASYTAGRSGAVDTPCAVEVNEQLIPRREHDRHVLKEGDRIEIVTLVGGG